MECHQTDGQSHYQRNQSDLSSQVGAIVADSSYRVQKADNAVVVMGSPSSEGFNNSFDEFKRRSSLEIENLLGKDDWHLAEGLLTIFLKGNTRQTIVFQDEKTRSAHSTSQHRSGTLASKRLQRHMLDLGSCKETISLFESNDIGPRATYEDKPSSMQSYHSPYIATNGDSASGQVASMKGNSLGSYANVVDTSRSKF